MAKQKKYSCPVCKKKYLNMETAQKHIQRKHPESDLAPEVKGTSVPVHTIDPGAEVVNKETEEPAETNVGQPLETGPITLQLSYSLSKGSPWKILSDGNWRIFHHPEFPASGIDVEQIQGLPGKTEAVSNVILNELDNSVKKTQVIILSPTREAAQKMYMLVSAAAAALSITTHLSIGGTNVREDGLLLKERPHVVVGTIGRLYSMLERKTINTGDISFLCVEGIQFLLGSKYENELSMFCEQLPNDLVVVLLSTKIRYKGHHDFGKLFTRKPLHFLVEEDPAPDPSLIPHDLVPIDVEKNRDYGAAAIMDTNSPRPRLFRCEVGDCKSRFPTNDGLDSHVRFFHWQTISNTAFAGEGVPHNDMGPSRTEGVMYLCGLCESYPPFGNSRAFGRHLKRMHFEPNDVTVSKVGLATHSASDGPYMNTYLVHQMEENVGFSESESTEEPF